MEYPDIIISGTSRHIGHQFLQGFGQYLCVTASRTHHDHF
jgi:hypothetical protein